ncbi:hypothetical protein B0H17DRAFT_1232984 [Mycena rosella]|uniref:Uncharacterized protein n=1 Tax=Mycena rosella TaxID=1033263 RepID=A0AAD7D5B4_MYCRO|nr:hypothetical protein B0H17DRAFT_1232984 [Mycena rosella]
MLDGKLAGEIEVTAADTKEQEPQSSDNPQSTKPARGLKRPGHGCHRASRSPNSKGLTWVVGESDMRIETNFNRRIPGFRAWRTASRWRAASSEAECTGVLTELRRTLADPLEVVLHLVDNRSSGAGEARGFHDASAWGIYEVAQNPRGTPASTERIGTRSSIIRGYMKTEGIRRRHEDPGLSLWRLDPVPDKNLRFGPPRLDPKRTKIGTQLPNARSHGRTKSQGLELGAEDSERFRTLSRGLNGFNAAMTLFRKRGKGSKDAGGDFDDDLDKDITGLGDGRPQGKRVYALLYAPGAISGPAGGKNRFFSEARSCPDKIWAIWRKTCPDKNRPIGRVRDLASKGVNRGPEARRLAAGCSAASDAGTVALPSNVREALDVSSSPALSALISKPHCHLHLRAATGFYIPARPALPGKSPKDDVLASARTESVAPLRRPAHTRARLHALPAQVLLLAIPAAIPSFHVDGPAALRQPPVPMCFPLSRADEGGRLGRSIRRRYELRLAKEYPPGIYAYFWGRKPEYNRDLEAKISPNVPEALRYILKHFSLQHLDNMASREHETDSVAQFGPWECYVCSRFRHGTWAGSNPTSHPGDGKTEGRG